MGIEKRKDRRYPFHVKALLQSGRHEVVAQTEDVSFKGVFVRTDLPLAERHLLRVKFTLPPEGDDYTVTGMVARSIPAKDGRPPGAGIQFYGASSNDLDRWNQFIRWVAAGAPAPQPAAPPAAAPVFPAGTPDAVQRRFPRYAAALHVNLRDVGELEQLYSQNVSQGGMFVGTMRDLPAGTALKLSVIHPNSGETFELEAVVRWRSGAPNFGLGLEFTGMDDRRREAFLEFVQSELPVEQVTFVAEGDPRLLLSGPREPGDPAPEDEVPLGELDET
jgi:uncharacterized protein (TIGR02266 family)